MSEPPIVPQPQINPEAARRAIETMRVLTEAMRPIVQAHIAATRRIIEALRPLAEWAERHPEELARWQRASELQEQAGACHRLCGTHREQAEGICAGVAAPGLTVRFDSPTVGVQHARMCRPCYEVRQMASA
jgi:hypothetical protein